MSLFDQITHSQLQVAQAVGNIVQTFLNKPTGWGDSTGTMSRAGFDTGSVSTEELAGVVAQLITDLKARGIIG
jgi:hypothetical protein